MANLEQDPESEDLGQLEDLDDSSEAVLDPPAAVEPLDARREGGRGWDVLLIAALSLLGLLLAFTAYNVYLADDAGSQSESPAVELTDADKRLNQVVSSAVLLVLMGVIPFAWVWGTRVGGLRGALVYLHLDRPWPRIMWAPVVMVGMFVLALVVADLASKLDPSLLDNPELENIGGYLNWPVILFISFVAGAGEEILFRGVIQRRVGLWAQAAIFGVVHLAYGTILQILLPFLLGLGFGYLVRRGIGLWAIILAHIAYDVIVFRIAKFCADHADHAMC